MRLVTPVVALLVSLCPRHGAWHHTLEEGRGRIGTSPPDGAWGGRTYNKDARAHPTTWLLSAENWITSLV